LIVERTKAGIAAAKRAGVRVGRPPKLTAAQIDKARLQIAGGATVEATAQSFNVSATTLARSLARVPPAPRS
jgi:DNA invertase Pin-like site-specific DNA recombinase